MNLLSESERTETVSADVDLPSGLLFDVCDPLDPLSSIIVYVDLVQNPSLISYKVFGNLQIYDNFVGLPTVHARV